MNGARVDAAHREPTYAAHWVRMYDDPGTVVRATTTFELPHSRVVVTEYADALASFLVWVTDDHVHAYREGDFSMLTRDARVVCSGCAP